MVGWLDMVTPAQLTGTSRHLGGGFVHTGAHPAGTDGDEQAEVPDGQAPPSGAGSHGGEAPPQPHSCTQAWFAPQRALPHMTPCASAFASVPPSGHTCPSELQVQSTPGCAEVHAHLNVSVQVAFVAA
jgi:hypothetical protein